MRRKASFFFYSATVTTLLSAAGCIPLGVAHVGEELPPLQVKGIVVRENGEPQSGLEFVLIRGRFWSDILDAVSDETLSAKNTSDGLDELPKGSVNSAVRATTDEMGEFRVSFGGYLNYIGFPVTLPIPVRPPSSETLRRISLGIQDRSHPEKVYVIEVIGESHKTYLVSTESTRLDFREKELFRVKDVVSSVERNDDLDLIHVRLEMPPDFQ